MLNLYLTYGKRQNLTYNDKPKVNIKWSNEPNAQAAMQAYFAIAEIRSSRGVYLRKDEVEKLMKEKLSNGKLPLDIYDRL